MPVPALTSMLLVELLPLQPVPDTVHTYDVAPLIAGVVNVPVSPVQSNDGAVMVLAAAGSGDGVTTIVSAGPVPQVF